LQHCFQVNENSPRGCHFLLPIYGFPFFIFFHQTNLFEPSRCCLETDVYPCFRTNLTGDLECNRCFVRVKSILLELLGHWQWCCCQKHSFLDLLDSILLRLPLWQINKSRGISSMWNTLIEEKREQMYQINTQGCHFQCYLLSSSVHPNKCLPVMCLFLVHNLWSATTQLAVTTLYVYIYIYIYIYVYIYMYIYLKGYAHVCPKLKQKKSESSRTLVVGDPIPELFL